MTIEIRYDENGNPKKEFRRALAKAKRGYGRIAMDKAGMDQAQWSQRHDPLFHVKGKARHQALHSIEA